MKKFLSLFLSLLLIISINLTTSPALDGEIVTLYKPKVSVIIPVYKVEPWLRECMDSVINQTLKEIEIICVNDGSPDNCGKILNEYASKDNRITVIHQKNQGVSVARNSGLELAHGEYITFADPDDYLNSNAYEIAYGLAKKDDVDILQFGSHRFTDRKIVKQPHQPKVLDMPIISSVSAFNKIDQYVWNKFYNAEIIQQNKLRFISKVKLGEDTIFSYMALAHAKKIKIIPTRLYNYRIRPGSAVSTKKREDFFMYHLIKIKPICDEWRKTGNLAGNETLFLNKFIRKLRKYSMQKLQYAKEILAAFGDDIYHPNVIKKCPDYIQKEIKKLELAAKAS